MGRGETRQLNVRITRGQFLDDDVEELSENIPNVEVASSVFSTHGTPEISLALTPVDRGYGQALYQRGE